MTTEKLEKNQTTPFAHWRERNEDCPYGGDYDSSYKNLTYGEIPCEVLATMLVNAGNSLTSIGILTAGKERLRWLSNKLYSSASCHKRINKKRATLTRGDLTDDELANEFYLHERMEDLYAGSLRMLWLIEEIQAFDPDFK